MAAARALAYVLAVLMPQCGCVQVYTVSNPDDIVTITVAPSTGAIRPYVVGAVLRNISFNKQRYNRCVSS